MDRGGDYGADPVGLVGAEVFDPGVEEVCASGVGVGDGQEAVVGRQVPLAWLQRELDRE